MVIGIISILFLTLKNTFQYKQKDYLYAETCINKIYGDMNNFSYAAMTSKWLYSWGADQIIYPDQYIIKLNSSDNLLDLKYKKDNSTIYYKRYILWSEEMANYYCTKWYTTKLSWDNITITINKTQKDNSLWGYTLYGSQNLFTGASYFFLCPQGWGICKELAMFEIDARIQAIKKKVCITIDDTTGLCTKRDQ